MKTPPYSKADLLSLQTLSAMLNDLIGIDFVLSGKGKTDGSNIRKLITAKLEQYDLPNPSKTWEVIPEKGKGIPKITRHYVDTYIITGSKSYNLQVWNRIPNSNDPQIITESGDWITPRDVRYVLVRVIEGKIACIMLMSIDYIIKNFGKFGNPTIKHQFLLPPKVRTSINQSKGKVYFKADSENMKKLLANGFVKPSKNFALFPSEKEVIPIEELVKAIAPKIIGLNVKYLETKVKGQALEKIILESLGYDLNEGVKLEGQYPDIRHQLLEIKDQDSQTVDLGKYTPLEESIIYKEHDITTADIRYLIVLVDRKNNVVTGMILCAGKDLSSYGNYVNGVSGKCQRSINLVKLEKYIGKCVVNPQIGD